jgi:hypothetical protein
LTSSIVLMNIVASHSCTEVTSIIIGKRIACLAKPERSNMMIANKQVANARVDCFVPRNDEQENIAEVEEQVHGIGKKHHSLSNRRRRRRMRPLHKDDIVQVSDTTMLL